MLKFGIKEKKILDLLLTKKPKVIAKELGIPVKKVYDTVHYFRKKVQNAEDFLGYARQRYKELIKRRLKTTRILPETEDETEEW